MKKLIAVLLVLVMVLSMVACTAKTEDPTSEAIPPRRNSRNSHRR